MDKQQDKIASGNDSHAATCGPSPGPGCWAVWMPIESAPKNGTQILIRCSGDRMAAVRWLDGMFIGTGWFAVVPINGGWGHGSDTFIQFKEDQPTHWTPLPNPPNNAVRVK